MRGIKPRVDRRGRVERGNGVDDGVVLRRKDERLTKRLEPPVGSVHTHHDAREHGHPATLSAERETSSCSCLGTSLPTAWRDP